MCNFSEKSRDIIHVSWYVELHKIPGIKFSLIFIPAPLKKKASLTFVLKNYDEL